jgi:HAE1 family hydrophobic/amphiphilic exporter-1
VNYKILVNPAEFINKSIKGVLHEVFIAAFLAVIVLFLFIGSFKNVATAAIEIPLSLVLAFILMKISNMNLNMISLGGLALSAGMNVDASVVVLENIFRHFEKSDHNLSFKEKTEKVIQAVREVRSPIIASTIASLVVFFPLIFTKGLTDSLLGDLAKAVVFSHGLSAVVALFLVPTIRLQLMKKSDVSIGHPPIESLFIKLENWYQKSLESILKSSKKQILFLVSISCLMVFLVIKILPKLDKEVIGRPETEWLIVGLYSPVFTNQIQLESEIQQIEDKVILQFKDQISYTFTQLNGKSNGHVMFRLKNRKDMDPIFKEAEGLFKNTSTVFYFVEKWNPSELNIPDPPDYLVQVVGGKPDIRQSTAENLLAQFTDLGLFDKNRLSPQVKREQFISIEPVSFYSSSGQMLDRSYIAHYIRTASNGSFINDLNLNNKSFPIYLRLPNERTENLEQIKALPISLNNKIVPISALANFSLKPSPLDIYRLNGESLVSIDSRLNEVNKSKKADSLKKAETIINEEIEKLNQSNFSAADKPRIKIEEADKELKTALNQLYWAVAVSILLVFLTMVLQLGSIIQSLLVLVAIPLGFIGVIVSLFIADSTLSLNSGLGTILLNGIAVANSIILVDFIQKQFNLGKSAFQSTVIAAKTRLRPILMTTLTTVLGMLPIALGLGEGGKILQPLGIAVSGGLWVSTILTLFVVPLLQYRYLALVESSKIKRNSE